MLELTAQTSIWIDHASASRGVDGLLRALASVFFAQWLGRHKSSRAS
jgi:hypothetical protein